MYDWEFMLLGKLEKVQFFFLRHSFNNHRIPTRNLNDIAINFFSNSEYVMNFSTDPCQRNELSITISTILYLYPALGDEDDRIYLHLRAL